MPSVTVVIPVYNGERFIRETLESVLAQTLQDHEIICVDDGSTDASVRILNEYRDRVCIIQQTNSGQAEARNVGVRRGKAKYIAFLDQDDRWYPKKLERQVDVLENNPDVVMVHCDMDWIDGTGQVVQRSVGLSTKKSIQKGLTMTRLIGWDPHILPSTMLIRRAAFDLAGGFDAGLRCGEDIDLMIRLRDKGRFLFLEETGTQYRKHSANFSGLGSDSMFSCSEKFFRKLGSLYGHDTTKRALLDQFLAQLYSDWGKMKIRIGHRRDAQHLLLRSLRYYPWKLRTYSRLFRALVPKL
jgi:glycosyltransferase involved in cell wall biosynthesis